MAESSKPKKAIAVFFSYSHEDEGLRDELSNHLAMLQRQEVITAWHDRRIGAGKEWGKEIDEHLNTADIILLLVSSAFLASDYCYNVEMKTAMKRHDDGEARVIPVILRPVDWKGAPFGKLHSLPTDASPVTGWQNRDEAFRDVALGIRVVAEELAVNQIGRLFKSLDRIEGLKNWPDVIALGERILKLLPDHLPESQAVRSKTAAAYVKRWARCFHEDHALGGVRIETKRNENRERIRDKIMADLNRAIELDPENGEYYYLRHSVGGEETDLDSAIKLDPSIRECLFDGRRLDLTDALLGAGMWPSGLKKPIDDPKPIEIKEPRRLKCLRD